MQANEKTKLLLFILLVVYILYGWMFIQQTSITFEGQKYYTLFDDAMISMRYAKNLANGHGLAWNPGGEKIEGYTNFLWVLYMTAPHFLKIPAAKTAFFIRISAMAMPGNHTYKNHIDKLCIINYNIRQKRVILEMTVTIWEILSN